MYLVINLRRTSTKTTFSINSLNGFFKNIFNQQLVNTCNQEGALSYVDGVEVLSGCYDFTWTISTYMN